MTRFLDGPAAGVVLILRRAPHFLRAVCPVGTKDWDALDQVTDRPAPNEQIVVYELHGDATWMHLRARKGGGIYRGGAYRVVDPQPDDSTVRDQVRWEAWAIANFPKEDRRANGE